MSGRRRWFVVSAFLAACALVFVLMAPLAQAAVTATASATPAFQYLNDTTGTTFTLTINNTSTASESLGSVQITRPGTQWTITACPVAPAGWTAVAAGSTCTFNSASGTGDNIASGGTATLKVKATTAAGSANVTGSTWSVTVDQDDTYDGGSNSAAASPSKTGALSITLYGWQVLSAVVSASTASIGAACPAANKTATAGSSQVIVICGKNRANVALSPASAASHLAGTFIAAAGAFSSGSVAAQSASSVVLANYSNTTITSSVGTGKTVISRIGSSSTATSPSTTLKGYSTTAAASWPKFHHDLNNSGYNPNETTIGTSNVWSLVQQWTGSGAGGDSSPAVANGVVYVGETGDLAAFDAAGVTGCSGSPKTCTPLWTGIIGSGVSSSPAVANGVVYVGSLDDKLYAFDAAGVTGCSGSPKTCAPLWTGATGSFIIKSSPAVANGVVYIGSDDHKLYAFDAAGITGCSGSPKTCAPLWTGATGAQIRSSPAVANGVVYVGSFDHKLYAFDAAGVTGCSGSPTTCAPLWTAATGNLIESSPAVANGVVYVGSDDGHLYAYDAAGITGCSGSPTTCTPLWTSNPFAAIRGAPAVANGVVYVGNGSAQLLAYDAAGVTGCSGTICDPLWKGNTVTEIDGSPAVAGGVVYVNDNAGKIYAFDAAGVMSCSGSPKICASLWVGATSGFIDASSPVVVNGVLYVTDEDGKLYAFTLR